MLAVTSLTVNYGRIRAVRGISFEVRRGEIVALIGANGAGKSSVLRAVSGLEPSRGAIVFEGCGLQGRPPDRIVSLGLAQVPEGRGIFGNLTVAENLRLASWSRRDRRAIAADQERVYSLFPRLSERRRQSAGTLSGGEQQMLAMGRALVTRARLLMLDEPSMGLAPALVQGIFKLIAAINREGTTIILVEQNAHMALGIADRGYVLQTGRIVLTGTGRELAAHPMVQEAYLGG